MNWLASALPLFFASLAIACPKGAPVGFAVSPGQKERSYNDAKKTVEVVVKCDERLKSAEALKALAMIGEVHVVDRAISYVELQKGTMRMYVGTSPDVAQVAVIAKTPEALEKAAPAIVEYLKSK
jgi:hypothetical protein